MAKKKATRRTNGSPPKKRAAKAKPTLKPESEPEPKPKPEKIEVPISREFPAGQVGFLSNHFVIQHDGPEFHLLFFQTHPPVVLTETEDEARKVLEKAEARSVCVARIIVSAERMPSFVSAMQQNLEKYGRHQEQEAKQAEPPRGPK